MVCLNASLDYISAIGVPAIRDHAARLATQLRAELPRHGYECLSPPDAAGHISAFRIADMEAVRGKLEKVNIRVRLTQNFMRVSVSVFNSERDIDALAAALA
jgi:selenocysteine lyase/cysteine desulfurase